MLKKYKFILLSILITGAGGIVGYLLKGINITQETYETFAGHPLFISVSILPLIGCIVFGFIIGKKYYSEGING